MVYLDYSATTPVNDEVLNTFVKVSKQYIGNPNSLHLLGVESKKLMEETERQIKKLLKVNHDVIFTSSSTESNNLAILGTSGFYSMRNKHIITTKLEHSSTLGCVNELEKMGFKISYVTLDEAGLIDLNLLESLLKTEPLLFSCVYVDSELGIIQNLDELKKLLVKYPKTIFHLDATGAVGKVECDFTDVDLVSFSAHKFYGLKGIACLLKKSNISLKPLIYGGKSQSDYRSGTPALPLMVSMAKALRLTLDNLTNNYIYVRDLRDYLLDELSKFSNIVINTKSNCSPYIINISLRGIKPETMIHALGQHDIFVSTKSACSKSSDISTTLFEITGDREIASSSIRISLSYLTTKQDLLYFLNYFEKCLVELNFIKGEY